MKRITTSNGPVCHLRASSIPARVLEKADRSILPAWRHDACRHSFATYHVALFGSVERTSIILGHEGRPTLLHQRYRGVATRAEAEEFFRIAQ